MNNETTTRDDTDPKAEPVTPEAFRHMMLGAGLLSGGGGGDPLRPPTAETEHEPVDISPGLISPDDMDDEDDVLIVLGGGGGVSLEEQDRWIETPRGGFGPSLEVQRRLFDRIEDRYPPLPGWEQMLGDNWIYSAIEEAKAASWSKRKHSGDPTKPRAILAVETSMRFITAIGLASSLGYPVVNGDLVGGSPVPELSLTSLNICGIEATPVIVATQWGDVLSYNKFLSYQRLEDVIRSVASASGGSVLALTVQNWCKIKSAVYHHTFARAQRLGKALEGAIGKPDPVGTLLDNSAHLIEKLDEGIIDSHIMSGIGGFFQGRTILSNEEKRSSSEIIFKNENILGYRFLLYDSGQGGERRLFAEFPTTITICHAETLDVLYNRTAEDWYGRPVVVLGIKRDELPLAHKDQGRLRAIYNLGRWHAP